MMNRDDYILAQAEAERQLIELVRGQGAGNFTLTVVSQGGKWIVATTNMDSGGYCSGDGENFAEAWHRQENPIFTEGKRRPPLKPIE
jgi:hypothetical protein